MMGDEVLQTIRSGDVAAYVVVIESAAATVVGRLPNPTGSDWIKDDIEDLVASFYASPGYEHAVLNAHDDESLRKLVYTGVANIVRGELRASDRGRLHRRLKDILSGRGYVERPAKFWRRSSDPVDASGGSTAELLEAAWGVDVQVVRWRPDARRNSPVAEGKSLLALLDAVFERADGAVHENVLVEVLGQRLGVGPTTFLEDLDVVEECMAVGPDVGPEGEVIAGEAEREAAEAALKLWGELSPRERQLVPHLSASARQAAEAVGGGKSATSEAMNRLREKFRIVLVHAEDDHKREVLRELLHIASE
ncbi:MAG: hypothetical protein ACXWA9_10720 [Acidimicrobiia bacterium]